MHCVLGRWDECCASGVVTCLFAVEGVLVVTHVCVVPSSTSGCVSAPGWSLRALC